jgi:hypothetical protein
MKEVYKVVVEVLAELDLEYLYHKYDNKSITVWGSFTPKEDWVNLYFNSEWFTIKFIPQQQPNLDHPYKTMVTVTLSSNRELAMVKFRKYTGPVIKALVRVVNWIKKQREIQES